MIKTLLNHKVTGIYVLLAGFLARYALDGPRTVGIHDFIIDYVVIGFAAIIASAAANALFGHWQQKIRASNNGRPTTAGLATLRIRAYIVALIAASLTLGLVAVQRGDYIDWPFRVVLFLVSVLASLVTDSFDRANSEVARKI